ncbi:MAG: hypothetical protein A3A96_01960 [Candidatus Zambryskibacteria bacterium RIFCSPLOWO2_01_FULL_39_39]|uniref:Uncharacterized protein n=1 Tax=Candidatus Zambryskibacteria bacterium RIFCSPLOWO2_01_FULL_39_39 TaxID=1802758 RepID=A0A1G2TVX1_9BACT|nr:MAG: hypothetical protein A2644_02070 [Candidatus Zambryskibacteria bacterium RIFCSPHIGHO2_01_FULL_39_63]OHA94216.1 MAG: hypothetical protein A3B88_03645 [Candidatus Zambryskibacteria bacterium RIFCSPHIGHO2_02_FULL_39_19]OHA98518.1 MAG: hypothetical protein A3F20_03855 [Candidatus Zambryskibacteria bacterium RIFCSPHIGHO2_12_FULL_39_21]OHB01437.1 MAG: hypothetical protein A3A96_01960 [Candidatus Zambryskibacteria bacterium RIFCSPLOWO2_01_FULL_39_39]
MKNLRVWLQQNHFFEIPKEYNFVIKKEERTRERFILECGFQENKDNSWYPLIIALDLRDPNRLGPQMYNYTFFGRLEHTPWWDRGLSAMVVFFTPIFHYHS